VVHPLGLVVKNQVWYLIAQTDAGQRTFRISRVRSVEPTGEAVCRPEGFDLAAAWRAIVTTLDTQRAPAAVHVRADAETVGILRSMFGRRVIEGVTHSDGRIDVEIRGHSEEMVARQLAGLAGRFEVLSSDAVREHLADLGRTLVEHYADGSAPGGQDGSALGGPDGSALGDG